MILILVFLILCYLIGSDLVAVPRDKCASYESLEEQCIAISLYSIRLLITENSVLFLATVMNNVIMMFPSALSLTATSEIIMRINNSNYYYMAI